MIISDFYQIELACKDLRSALNSRERKSGRQMPKKYQMFYLKNFALVNKRLVHTIFLNQ